MPNIPGSVPLGGFIAPSDPGDTYAVQDSVWGRGGLREVASHAARNAITADRRREGMMVFTQNDGQYWRLLASPWTYTDGDWVAWSSGSPTSYTHTQGSASATWNITHPLNKYPAVTIVDSGGNEVEGTVTHNSTSSVTVTFSYPFSGVAYLN